MRVHGQHATIRKAFVELTKLFQGRFQGLWVLYFLTRVQFQVGIHTQVYRYAFTCSGYHFFSGIICHDIQPIRSNGIPKNLDIADIAMPIAMLMEREPDTLKLQSMLIVIPCLERKEIKEYDNAKSNLLV